MSLVFSWSELRILLSVVVGALSFIDIPNNATDGKQVNGLPLNVTELAEVKRHSLSSIFGDSG